MEGTGAGTGANIVVHIPGAYTVCLAWEVGAL